ncbi:MAG: PilW family protein [Pseudomonadales bacterium]
MNKMTNQKGMTIVELLIAMGLGIFLMAGVVQVFLGSKQTFTTINAQSHMQENGRFAMDFMARILRHGGYTTEINIDEILDPILRKETFLAQGDFAEGIAVTGVNNAALAGVKAGTDVVRVRIEGSNDSPVTDCQGVVIAPDQWSEISYGVTDDAEFQCQTINATGTTTVTLVEGIDDLQIQYGVNVGGVVDTFDYPDDRPDEQLLTASKFVNADDMTADDWEDVVSIKVAMLASSDGAPLEHSVAQTYDVLDNATVSYQDGKARQIFTQTISLRNPVYPAE